MSSIGSLTLEGVLGGIGSIEVTSSLSALGPSTGNLSGSGSTIIGSGASASFLEASISERKLVNHGNMVIPSGRFYVENGATIENSGLLTINAEGVEGGIVHAGYDVSGLLTNTGTIRKTSGTGLSFVATELENSGTIDAETGTLVFHRSVKLKPSSSLGDNLSFDGGGEQTVTDEAKSLSAGALKVDNSRLVVANSSVLSVGSLSLIGGRLEGAGEVTVSKSFTNEDGYMEGAGSTVVLPTATGILFRTVMRGGYSLVNEGAMTLASEYLIMGSGTVLRNRGTFTANAEGTERGITIDPSSSPEPRIVNENLFQKTAGTGTTEILPPFENDGSIVESSGTLRIRTKISVSASTATGHRFYCGDPVDCATGDFSESQTDLAVGGRGVGLDLTRTYNAQAAAAGASGIFGRGWTNSFGETLTAEEGGAKETLTEASGATVPFVRSGASWAAPGWSRDALSGSTEAGFTLTLFDQTKERFSGTGRLESVTDRDANTTSLAYDGSGRLEKITDPTGRTIVLAYNAGGLVEKATDPMGHVVRYSYESGNLKSVTLPGESAPNWQFGYDGSHRLTSMTDGRGGTTTNEYDGANRVISQTDPAGRTITWNYESFHTTVTHKATGSVTDEWFNSNNQPVSVTRGYGTSSATTESFTYTSAGLLASRTDGDGHTTTYGYDAEGNRTSERDAEGDETRWTFNGAHELLTTTTPRGETTTIERELDGNPKAISRPAPGSEAQTVSFVYGSHGEVESMTEPLGNKWTYKYDAYGDRTAEIDPLSDRRTWAYNKDSQVVSTVSPRGNESGVEAAKFTTTIERDAQGRPVKVTDPLGGATRYAYDADGDIESVTDPQGHTTRFTYDADGERTKVERPDGSIQETGYDGAGQVVSQTDGRKDRTTYVRNVLEQPVEIIDPLERKAVQTFDAAGNLKTKTDPEGRTTTYVYDRANRPKEVLYSAEAGKDVTYAYDADGDLTKMVDATGESTFEYDQLGRLTHSRNGNGETLGWTYNLADEATGLTYPNGKSISRTYDKAGRLGTVTDWLGHKTSFAYSRDSEPTKTTFPTSTGDIDEYAYDRADRMSGVLMDKGTKTLASIAYTRDPAGMIESLIDKGLPGAEEEAFGYDEDERLTKAGTSSYEYDAADDVTKAPGTTNVFDSASELETATGQTFTYDKEGERTKQTPTVGMATTYGYDQSGQLVSVGRAAEGKTPAIAESFGYDGLGLLASKTVGGTTRHLVWDPTESPEALLSDGEYSYIYGPDGLPVEQISAGEVPTYIHHDQLGSTRLLTSSSGEPVGTFTYGAYGAPTGHTGTATTALGYAGQYTLGQSGLLYLRARFYDPATGQFLTLDPAVEVTREPYGYADDDPMSYNDPIGAFAVPVVGDACLDPDIAIGCAFVGGGVATVAAIEGHGSVEGAVGSVFGEADRGAEEEELEALDNDEERHSENVSDEACKIAEGHAFDKHGSEFDVESPDELARIIDDTINDATHFTDLSDGRSAYYDDETDTLVVIHPDSPDGGTVYKPTHGIENFDLLK